MITITDGILLALLALWVFAFFYIIFHLMQRRCGIPLRPIVLRNLLCSSAVLGLYWALDWSVKVGVIVICFAACIALGDYIGG